MKRRLSLLDHVIERADLVLRAATRTGLRQRRPNPGSAAPEQVLANRARQHAAGLMRVNHSGEVCAQALYVGQAVLARDPATYRALVRAASEEGDHLFWCAARLAELDSRPSRLDGLWFGGAFIIGCAAGALGDRLSLGFVEETEKQVVEHLEGHLGSLPAADARSRAIVLAMRADEARHAQAAAARGARALPGPLRRLMRWNASVMTTLAYWI